VKSKDINYWRNNRASSMSSKVRRWKSNPFGAAIRFLEILYFGRPLFNIFIGNKGKSSNSAGIELIFHMSNSVNSDLTNEDYIFLENVRIDLGENFIQLDTGHILNTRKSTNELFSGQYWSQVRRIQKSRIPNVSHNQMVYPIANQKFFYHFLLEELPEIINAHNLGLVEKFISLENQPSFVEELINLAGIKLEYIRGDIQNFRKVICPTYSRSNSTWAIEQLRVLTASNLSKISGPEKILLLRAGEVRSDSHFEQSLQDFLMPKGFEYVDLKFFSNAEQIGLFQNAKEIVAIHGGALSNIVFTKKNCRIFEIFTHPYRTYFFRDIARIKGNEYIGTESNNALEFLETWLSSNS
jgi:capsular polysaccharide biosynthesis protein